MPAEPEFVKYPAKPRAAVPRRSAAFEAVAICIVIAGVLAFVTLNAELRRLLDGQDAAISTGEKFRAMLPLWALVAGILSYDVLVLRFSGLLLSTWGYVWRTWVIGSIGNVLLKGMHAWAPWDVGRVDEVFVWIVSPWILAWLMLRLEDAKRPKWSTS